MLATAWIIAQEHWIEYRCIPKKAWPRDLDVLIEVELAEVQQDGSIYVKGSRNAFQWLDQKSEAGKKGGRPKSTNNSKAYDKRSLSVRLTDENGSKPLTLTPTPTLTPTLKENNIYISTGIVEAVSQYDALDKNDISQLLEEWKVTLNYFSIPTIAPGSDYSLASLAKAKGYQDTILAIQGMREERGSDDFRPGEWVSTQRLAKNFERFRNLGAMKHERDKKRAAVEASEGYFGSSSDGSTTPPEGNTSFEPPTNEQISEFIASIRAQLTMCTDGLGQDGTTSNNST